MIFLNLSFVYCYNSDRFCHSLLAYHVRLTLVLHYNVSLCITFSTKNLLLRDIHSFSRQLRSVLFSYTNFKP